MVSAWAPRFDRLHLFVLFVGGFLAAEPLDVTRRSFRFLFQDAAQKFDLRLR
jgi:hypothetical protein